MFTNIASMVSLTFSSSIAPHFSVTRVLMSIFFISSVSLSVRVSASRPDISSLIISDSLMFSSSGFLMLFPMAFLMSSCENRLPSTAAPQAFAILDLFFGITPGVKGSVLLPVLTALYGLKSILTAI